MGDIPTWTSRLSEPSPWDMGFRMLCVRRLRNQTCPLPWTLWNGLASQSSFAKQLGRECALLRRSLKG